MSHKVTPRQRKAIYLLARGITGIEVAKQLGLRRETLSRWKKRPEFVQELERFVGEMREGVRHRLSHLVDASITAVQVELGCPTDPKRIQTALNVLKMLGLDRAVLPKLSDKVPD